MADTVSRRADAVSCNLHSSLTRRHGFLTRRHGFLTRRRSFLCCADVVSYRHSFLARRRSFLTHRHSFYGAPTRFPTDAVSYGAPTQFCSAPTQLLMVVKPWRWSCFGGSRPCFGGSLVTSELLVDNITYLEPLDHPLHHGADHDGG